jgi:hypothetical protein
VSFAAAAFDFVIAHQPSTWEIEKEKKKEAMTVNETGDYSLPLHVVFCSQYIYISRFFLQFKL